MVTKVNDEMLEGKAVSSVSLAGNVLSFGCTDNTTIQLNLANMPALQPIADMVAKLNQITAYIAAHP